MRSKLCLSADFVRFTPESTWLDLRVETDHCVIIRASSWMEAMYGTIHSVCFSLAMRSVASKWASVPGSVA